LYNDLSKKETTTFTDISKIEAIDLSSATKNYQTRQGYHQMKDYNIINNQLPSQKELEDFNYLYAEDDNKPHDINAILKEARALREKDEIERKRKEERIKEQEKKFSSNKLKVLVASHPYNLYDSYISGEVITHLKKENIEIIYSDIIQRELIDRECKNISTDIHWTHSKEVMASISRYQKKVDGMILISSFPCGPDSLAIEMIKRKVDIPTLYLVFENENSTAGITTRLESFFDILRSKKEVLYERGH